MQDFTDFSPMMKRMMKADSRSSRQVLGLRRLWPHVPAIHGDVEGPRGRVEMWRGYFQDKGDSEPIEYVLPVSREGPGVALLSRSDE